MARTVLLNLLGTDNTGRAFRSAAREADRTADSVDRADRSAQNADDSHGRLVSTLTSLAPAAGQAAGSILSVAAGLGAAVPAAAGLAAALVAIAPAAAVAATAIGAGALAMGAFKIGMQGVGDAAKAALDPSNPEAYAAALKKLSPNARAFVEEIHKLQPAFAGIKTAVQDTLFQGLDKSFASAAKTTLPIFRKGLVDAAGALNGMGKNLLSTIEGLGKSGTLSTLFDGATAGLKNLTKIPGQLLKGFVQLGAAAAPTFQKMTAGIGNLATKASTALSGAFKSGAMTEAIDTAVGLLKQLGQVAGNVFRIVSNVFGAAQVSGGGFVGTLEKITAALADVTANPAFQQGLQAIFGVMNQLATTAAPLLAQALLGIAPVFTALGPPVQAFIAALGPALQPVIAALGPALVGVATSFGTILTAITPLLPVLATLITAVLVPITPLLTTLVPLITGVVGALRAWSVVQGILNVLLAANPLGLIVIAIAAVAAGLIYAYQHSDTFRGAVDTLWTAVKNLWSGLQPLITKLMDLGGRVMDALKEAFGTVGDKLKTLKDIFAKDFADALNTAKEALKKLNEVLTSDGPKALNTFSMAASKATGKVAESFTKMANKAIEAGDAIAPLAISFKSTMDRMVAAEAKAGRTLWADWKLVNRGLIDIVKSAGSGMYDAGAAIMNSLRDGMAKSIAPIRALLQQVTDMIPDWKGPAAKDRVLLTPSGIMIMEGLNDGIETGWKKTKNVLGRITDELKDDVHKIGWKLSRASFDFAIISIGEKLQKALTGTVAQINEATKKIAEKIRAAFKADVIGKNQRDGLLDYLSATNTKLKELSKERQKIVDKIKEIQDYAKQVTSAVLNYAAITNIQGSDGAAPTGGQLVAGLQARLATIREFGANIKKLAGAGLSKALLRQILDAGIDGGAAIAAELANGPSSIIAALNTAQTSITKVAKAIGIDGADALFGSGKAMGDAFLKGLKSLEKALVDQMEYLIEKLLTALGLGVDKAKGKLAELVAIQAKLGEYNATPKQESNATPLKVQTPAAAPKAPVYQYIPPSKSNVLSSKNVSVNLGGVTVRERADVDMLMNASAFAARSLQF